MAQQMTADEFAAAVRLLWGTRFSAGTEEAAEFLGINHRSILKKCSGEMPVNPGVAMEVLAELAEQIPRSQSPFLRVLRLAQA